MSAYQRPGQVVSALLACPGKERGKDSRGGSTLGESKGPALAFEQRTRRVWQGAALEARTHGHTACAVRVPGTEHL